MIFNSMMFLVIACMFALIYAANTNKLPLMGAIIVCAFLAFLVMLVEILK